MRFHLSILLCVLVQPIFAEGYNFGGTDADSYRRAQADLQRQKDWLNRREAEQRRGVPAAAGYAAVPTYDRDSIYACLMKVTATSGLRPGDQAQRKVRCYPGGVGLIEECKSSVVATMHLSSAEEASIKNMCR